MAGLHVLLILLCLQLTNFLRAQVNIQQNNYAQQIIQQNNIQQNIQQNNVQQNIIIKQNIEKNIALIKTEFAERNLNTGALDLMESHIKGLYSNFKVQKAGTAISETLKFFKSLKNKEFHGENGGKQLAVSLIKLTGKFAEIGGAFAPPPIGTALTVGFDIINSFMSLIGVVPEAPSMRDIMKELLDQQTAEIRSMFEEFINNNFWKNFEYKAKGVVDNFIKTHIFLRSTLNTTLTQDELQSSLCLFSLIQGGEFFTILEEHLKDTCKNMVTSKDETRCITLLDYYSKISSMRQTQFDMLIKLTSQHFANLTKAYQKIREDETDKMKRTLEELTMIEAMDGLTCLRIKISSSPEDELIFTKNALIMVGIKIELSAREKGLVSLICPSSSTKMMLISGYGWDVHDSVELVSPSKQCPLTIPKLPKTAQSYKNYKSHAALYTTEEGENRVMVCGGLDWLCRSFGEEGTWRVEPNLVIDEGTLGMAGINSSLYTLGGFDKEAHLSNIYTSFHSHGVGWSNWSLVSNFTQYYPHACTVSFGDHFYVANTQGNFAYHPRENLFRHIENTPHNHWACTVAIISGHAVWVVSGVGDVSYIRLTPDITLNYWITLPKPPNNCASGLGWSEKKLMCLNTYDTHYYDEDTSEWIKTPHGRHYNRADNAYVNVPSSWGCN